MGSSHTKAMKSFANYCTKLWIERKTSKKWDLSSSRLHHLHVICTIKHINLNLYQYRNFLRDVQQKIFVSPNKLLSSQNQTESTSSLRLETIAIFGEIRSAKLEVAPWQVCITYENIYLEICKLYKNGIDQGFWRDNQRI